MSRFLGAVLAALLLPCCSPPPDGDGDADGEVDAGDGDADSDADEGDADADEGDADADDDDGGTGSEPTEPAEVLREGTAGLLLRGVVLTPTGVLDPGEVLVSGSEIRCVAEDCTGEPEAEDATWIDTHGIVSPGLIDSHNHLGYDFLPEWVPDPPRLFQNRYEWADDPSYEAHIEPFAAHRTANSHFCPAAKWGELRALVHGATTIQGQPSGSGSCINWGIRNANRYHGLGHDHMRQNIGDPRDLTDADAEDLIADYEASVDPVTRYHVHMAEGIGGSVLEEFDSFAGRDPRSNHHQGVSLLHLQTAILIHSVPLTEEQLLEVADTGSHVVWSPSSNFALYGDGVTAPIARILELEINVGIGPDWTPSGEDEMLSELRVCLAYGRDEGIAALTPERLWEMATWEGAIVVGLEDHLGQLVPGLRADVAVFGRRGSDPYAALIDSRAADVRLVLVDGLGFYGDAGLESATARNEHCDAFDACGTPKYLCVQDSPTADTFRDQTLEDIRTALWNILEGVGYPPEEQYGRGDELLELVDCSL